jgi:hypothetical protein
VLCQISFKSPQWKSLWKSSTCEPPPRIAIGSKAESVAQNVPSRCYDLKRFASPAFIIFSNLLIIVVLVRRSIPFLDVSIGLGPQAKGL